MNLEGGVIIQNKADFLYHLQPGGLAHHPVQSNSGPFFHGIAEDAR